jgi:hypothetical protein
VVYILDQVRALESEMLENIKKQGLEIEPKILVVCITIYYACVCMCAFVFMYVLIYTHKYILPDIHTYIHNINKSI